MGEWGNWSTSYAYKTNQKYSTGSHGNRRCSNKNPYNTHKYKPITTTAATFRPVSEQTASFGFVLFLLVLMRKKAVVLLFSNTKSKYNIIGKYRALTQYTHNTFLNPHPIVISLHWGN